MQARRASSKMSSWRLACDDFPTNGMPDARGVPHLWQCFVSLAWFIFLGGMIGGSFRVLRIENRKRAALIALAIMLPALIAAVFARAAGV